MIYQFGYADLPKAKRQHLKQFYLFVAMFALILGFAVAQQIRKP
jgi:hypothetical protein